MSIVVYGFRPGYQRKGIFPVPVVFRLVTEGLAAGLEIADLAGDAIQLGSQRYQVFMRSLICVRCGAVGTYFAKERSARYHRLTNTYTAMNSRWHLNLYAVLRDGREVLMTKDHIVPKALGGPDHMSNYQTMCCLCNCKKGSAVLRNTENTYKVSAGYTA